MYLFMCDSRVLGVGLKPPLTWEDGHLKIKKLIKIFIV